MSTVVVASSAILSGASGILVPLGFENFMSVQSAQMFYNYIAVILLLLIASVTGSKGEAAWCVIIPILGGLEFMFGWLTFGNPTNAVACLVVAGILGVGLYMNDQNREKYGIAGPGSKYLNIMMFIIVFQVCLGMIPTLGIFGAQATSAPVFNQSYCPPSATCTQYSNIQFQSSLGTINGASSLGTVGSVLYGLTTAFIGMIQFLFQAFVAVVTSASVITNLVQRYGRELQAHRHSLRCG